MLVVINLGSKYLMQKIKEKGLVNKSKIFDFVKILLQH